MFSQAFGLTHPSSQAIGLMLALLYMVALGRKISLAPKSLARKACASVRRWFISYKYLFYGLTITAEEYAKANGKPFVVHTPEKDHYMVTSKEHIRELDKALRNQVSLDAVAKDFLQSKYTMNGFHWLDQRGVEATGLFRAIRSLISAPNMPSMMPQLSEAISCQVASESRTSPSADGWSTLSIFDLSVRIVMHTNCSIFFPKELSENAEFMKAALDFTRDVFIGAEIIRLFPRGIGPFLARWATNNYRNSKVMNDCLLPVIQSRMDNKRATSNGPMRNTAAQHKDLIQWLVDTTPDRATWSSPRLVGEIMAAWYGSLHTLSISMTNALIDLYSHPEYIESLRREVQGPMFAEFIKGNVEGLPEVDSFLRESVRNNAFEATIIRRQALQPFTFSDGLHVPRGQWICVPYRAMMRDERFFPRADVFDGRRFLPKEGEAFDASKAGLSHSSDDWLLWGVSRLTCPGKFYSTAVLKLVFSELLTGYDCELEQFKGERAFMWRGTLVPKPSIKLRIRPRRRDSAVGI